MLNMRIRSLIDEIFSDMKMTAENLALRDELMANAHARYEDAVKGGKSEEEAFAEVASSLGDVRALLRDMQPEEDGAAIQADEVTVHASGETVHIEGTNVCVGGENAAPQAPEADGASEPKADVHIDLSDFDLGDTLNKAFSALGDLGRQIMPQAKKLARQVDEATDGALGGLGKAVNRGMRDAQKAASETIDRLSGDKGELVFDFGGAKGGDVPEQDPQELRRQAQDMLAEAGIKQAVGDHETAQALREQAEALMTRADAVEQAQAIATAQRAAAEEAEDALERVQAAAEEAEEALSEAQEALEEAEEALEEAQEAVEEAEDALEEAEEALEDAQDEGDESAIARAQEALCAAQAGLEAARAAQREAQAAAEAAKATADRARDASEKAEEALERAEKALEEERSYIGEDGEIDQDAFTKAVDDMVRDAHESAGDGVPGDGEPVKGASGERRFAAAGLRTIEVKLDADDVRIEPTDEPDIAVCWSNMGKDNAPVVTMEGHRLTICRPNPDVFKTFFSVFGKKGGRIAVRVPRGYAADYELCTTSGDIVLTGIDVDKAQANTTSGDVRVEPDTSARAKEIAVNTVSGDVTVSACASDINVNGVSGDLFVSCDAMRASANVVSGDLHVEGASDEWEIGAVSGDAELVCTVSPTRKIDLNTVSGGIDLALPGDIRGFVVELSGISGHIVNEFGPNRYGTCALPIHMDTVSGNLIIRRL